MLKESPRCPEQRALALGASHHLHELTQSDGDRKGGWDCTDILQLEVVSSGR